jgi:hypothetical protein
MEACSVFSIFPDAVLAVFATILPFLTARVVFCAVLTVDLDALTPHSAPLLNKNGAIYLQLVFIFLLCIAV